LCITFSSEIILLQNMKTLINFNKLLVTPTGPIDQWESSKTMFQLLQDFFFYFAFVSFGFVFFFFKFHGAQIKMSGATSSQDIASKTIKFWANERTFIFHLC